ncbi:MAG: hypothetical protein H0X66_15895 [Verrucomicrobia bacterium]|nr:hypothetical protein [Verrucomicrobiota bacterium]
MSLLQSFGFPMIFTWALLVGLAAAQAINRGRDDALDCITPPSEPDGRFSRIRLSS